MNRLPLEILLKIEEFRKEAFMKKVRCFEDEHGYALRYNYVKNINVHMRKYWELCLKSMVGLGCHNDGLLDNSYNYGDPREYAPDEPDYYDTDEIGSDYSTDSDDFRRDHVI